MNLKEFIDARLRPNKKDVGLHTRSQQAGVHVHDNGSVELYAGQSSILLDGTTNTITINAKKLNQVAEKINLRMAAGGLTVPYGIINPQILPTETEALLSTTPVVKQMLEAQRSMLSPKNLLFMQTYGVKLVGAQSPTEAPVIPLTTVFNLIAPIKAVSPLSGINKIFAELKAGINDLG